MPQRNLLLLIAAVAVSYVCYAQGQQGPFGRYLVQGLTVIDHSALDSVPDDELFAGGMDGMVRVLREHGDQHSQFFDATEARRLRDEIHQQIGGIGVRIHIAGNPPQPTIRAPIKPDAPAAQAKLQAGDRILAVDDKPTSGLPEAEVVAMLNGNRGTSVRLAIERPDEKPRELQIVREMIPVESVLGDRRDKDGNWQFALEDDPRVAHVRIVSFGDLTALQFSTAMEELKAAGVQAIVLDLRDNVGGGLSPAVSVCQALLPAGKTVVETRGRNDLLRQRYATKSDGDYCQMPVAVIVNQNSASASEIVAASLQDNGRAAIIGQRSFGKGTVQQMLPIGKGLLKLTWAGFRRPSGANIHRASGAPETETWGVLPDNGCECVLSPKMWSAFREYRSRRDEADGEATDSAETFVDEPLRLAVRNLQHQIGGQP